MEQKVHVAQLPSPRWVAKGSIFMWHQWDLNLWVLNGAIVVWASGLTCSASHLPCGHSAQQKHQHSALGPRLQDQELASGENTPGASQTHKERGNPCLKACQSKQQGKEDMEVKWPACSYTLYQDKMRICSPNPQSRVASLPTTTETGWLQFTLETLLCSHSAEKIQLSVWIAKQINSMSIVSNRKKCKYNCM